MATSAFSAIIERYQSLSGVPTLYTFDVPPATGNTQILPPYAVANDNGTVPQYEFEHTVLEVSDVSFLVYGNTLELVDQYVESIKYNGGSTTAGLGLDFGPLPTLAVPYSSLAVIRVSERNFAATATGSAAQRIYGCELKYQVTVYRI